MRRWKEVAAAGGAMLVPGTPLWAHPERAIHIHAGETLPLLALAVALTVFLVWRRFRAHAPREG
ncbi:MAG TPA: hypothetical protein VLB00_13975 [Gemmatimonadales bacterium]|nr:hypothetical protein [Gemmatimonadales bacterium]